MPKASVESVSRLSPSQMGILFETLASAQPGIFLEQLSWRIHGPLDLDRLVEAWQFVAARRSTLRTGFSHKVGADPVQFVLARASVPVRREDWRGVSPEDQRAKLAAFIDGDRQQGFQLARAPLVRVALFQIADDVHEFVLTFHHILLDGWCVPLLGRMLFDVYQALVAGRAPDIGPDRPYRDYIAWLDGRPREAAETYWRSSLAGFRSPTPLGPPADRLAPGDDAAGAYGTAEARVPAAAFETLRQTARRAGLTMSAVVQGAWALLLSRYSGAHDVVFGVTVSGRPPDLPDVESMLGLFVNTVPLRFEVPEGGAFWPWLQAASSQQAAQREFEYCSSGQIHQWSELPASLPIYESILVFENYPNESGVRTGALTLRPGEVHAFGAQTRYPMTILAVPGDDLLVRIIFRTRYVGAGDAARVAAHLCAVLEQLGHTDAIDVLRSTAQAAEFPRVVRTPAAAEPAARGVASAAAGATEQSLAAIWADLLEIDAVDRHAQFFELGGHSLLVPALVARVRQTFGVELPLEIVFARPTIAAIAHWIDAHTGGSAAASWPDCLVALNPRGSATPIFWTHPVAGSPMCYVELVRRLGPDQPAYGFQSPGLTDGEPRLTRIEDMAARYIDAMRVVQPRGPYRIAGWSFGGLLAFEMARQLAGAGESVEFLAFIDTGVLDTRDRSARNLLRLTLLQLMPLVFLLHVKPPTSYASLKRLASWVGIGMPETRQEFFRRRDGHGARPLRRFVAGARRSLRVFLANLTASRRYVPSNYPGRVVVFRARRRLSPRDPFVEGSRKFAAGGVSVTLVEGNHMTVVLDPGRAGELAAHIRRALDAMPSPERLASLSR